MHTFFIETFGCQMNVADSATMAGLLLERGLFRTDSWRSADLVVVNTCSVREHAEQRARARLSEMAAAKRSGAIRQIWVVGCMAERLGKALCDEQPCIDQVIGARKMEAIETIIDRLLSKPAFSGGNPQHSSQIPVVSSFVPIMRGCDNYCAYCIVPFVRGPEHSLSRDVIINKIRTLVNEGTREVTLLGQNVNSYRDRELDFPGLLEELCTIRGLDRLRFTTSHPKDLSLRLVDVIAQNSACCHHIHLPVQAGSNRVLSRMNRRYSRAHYLSLITAIRRKIPHADITTDVMTGFPGETDDDFSATLALFREVRFTTAFMFAYSERSGTAAATMPDQVDQAVRKTRLGQLIDLQTSITREVYGQMVGKRVNVLVTGRQAKGDCLWMGQDFGCKRVLIDSTGDLFGKIVPVVVNKSTGMTLVGSVATDT